MSKKCQSHIGGHRLECAAKSDKQCISVASKKQLRFGSILTSSSWKLASEFQPPNREAKLTELRFANLKCRTLNLQTTLEALTKREAGLVALARPPHIKSYLYFTLKFQQDTCWKLSPWRGCDSTAKSNQYMFGDFNGWTRRAVNTTTTLWILAYRLSTHLSTNVQ